MALALDYVCAEYFVDAISISPSNKITFDFVKILKNLIGKEIGVYVACFLHQNSEKDFLYLFKKFPDIFTIEDNLVGLTDAFLSLYHPIKDNSKRYRFINPYVENWAVEYFKKILTRTGPKSYVDLFYALKIDPNNQHYAKYLPTAKDVFEILMSHSGHFTLIQNNLVFLNPVHSVKFRNNENLTETLHIFHKSVIFLLSCFKTLHYLQLKQCLSYVQENIKAFLEQVSLVRQREIFAVLPYVNMDAFGFLTIPNRCDVILPDFFKTILLLVCILALKKEMRLADLAVEFSYRILHIPNSFSYLSSKEQLEFITRYQYYFHVFYVEHAACVSLLPEFVFPECSFQQSLGSESNLGLPEIVIAKLKQSFLYLSKYFYPLNKKRAMKTLLHAIDDVRMAFCSLTDKDKEKFIRVCCNFMRAIPCESPAYTKTSTDDCILQQEKNLLFIIYMLTLEESELFAIIIQAMKEKSIDMTLIRSTSSDQIKYLKKLSGYINVTSDLVIAFTPSYYPIKSLIDLYSNLFSESECMVTEMVTQDNKTLSARTLLQDEGQSSSSAIKTSKDRKKITWITNAVPQESKTTKNKEESLTINESFELPEKFSKILSQCAELLNRYYKHVLTEHILKTACFSFTDIYNKLVSLPLSDQYAFVNKGFKFLKKERHEFSSIRNNEQKEILLITYYLQDGRRIHYRKIIQNLSLCDCERLSKLEDRSQYWYFREASNFFLIGSDGFVTLNESFSYIDLLVHTVVNDRKEHYTPSERSICKPRNVYKTHHRVQESMTTDLSTQSSSNYFSVDIQYSKNSELDSQIIHDDTVFKNVIIDLMFHILSVSGKMNIEKLCYRLSSFNVQGVQNMFSSYTVTEKINFFKNLSPLFEVSKDHFVSLNKHAAKKFVPKIIKNISEFVEKNNCALEKTSNFLRNRSDNPKNISNTHRSRSASVASTDISELSLSPSTSSGRRVRRRRSSKKKHENTDNKVSYEVHKVAITENSSKPLKKNYYSNNLGVQTSCSVQDARSKSPLSVSSEEECIIVEVINKKKNVDQGDSTPEITVDLTETAGVLLSDEEKCTSVSQVPETYQAKNYEKNSVELLLESKATSFEKAKKHSLSMVKGSHTKTPPRQPFKESTSFKLYKSSLALLSKNSLSEDESIDSPVNNNDKIQLVNDRDQALSETFQGKSHLPSGSACENVKSLKEIDEVSGTSNMPLSDDVFDSSEIDSSHQSYIESLVAEFLEEAKKKSPNPETSNLNVDHKDVCSNDKDNYSKPKLPNFILNQNHSAAGQISENELQCPESKISNAEFNTTHTSSSELRNEVTNLPNCTKVSESEPHQSPVPDQDNCDKMPSMTNVNSSKSELYTVGRKDDPVEDKDYDKVVEDRAVNFFSIKLKYCQGFDESISVDYLIRLVNDASAEVRHFMAKHYGHDSLPFFQKHEEVFYVSPVTRCVYFSRK